MITNRVLTAGQVFTLGDELDEIGKENDTLDLNNPFHLEKLKVNLKRLKEIRTLLEEHLKMLNRKHLRLL